MGFFRNIRDAMDEEFVIGPQDVQHDAAEPQEGEEPPRRIGGMLDRIGQGVFLAGAALLVAHAWHEERNRRD